MHSVLYFVFFRVHMGCWGRGGINASSFCMLTEVENLHLNSALISFDNIFFIYVIPETPKPGVLVVLKVFIVFWQECGD